MIDVFISHIEEDGAIAERIAQGLQAACYTTWLYEEDSVPGPPYVRQVAAAIDAARAVVLVISADSLGSYQVDREVVRAYEKQKPIFPVLKGISHVEFQARQPEWALMLGAAASIRWSEDGADRVLSRIMRGLQALGIEPSGTVPSPPKTIINPRDGAEMLYIPPGEFAMGTTDEEVEALLKQYPDWKREWFDDEKPQHRVHLDGYYIAKTPVTVAQYRAFCEATKRKMPDAPSWGWKEDHPIVNVTWNDAKAYADWAGVRLPAEAEWEKAARSTDGRTWPWGNEWDSRRCNNYETGPKQTTPVGSYPQGASPYGVLDMAGNVWEWCADRYGPYDPKDIRNPTGPKEGPGRVLRGGSWFDFIPSFFRAAYRVRDYPYTGVGSSGFRCVASEDSA